MAIFSAPEANQPPSRPASPPRTLHPLAGLLSFLVPGLGQIVQGRVAKGLLFLVCIYTLFFYGMYLGQGSVTIGSRTYRLTSNVYLPSLEEGEPKFTTVRLGRGFVTPLPTTVANRLQYLGQFWVGIAAWPAILQHLNYDRPGVEALQRQLDNLYSELSGNEKSAEPDRVEQKRREIHKVEQDPQLRHPYLGEYMREPSIGAVNAVNNGGDKGLELAWVYTVIAGVLNILVIYDAVAGPAHPEPRRDPAKDPS